MRRRMLAPITSIKHYVQTPAQALSGGVRLTKDLVTVVAKGAARVLATDVEEGCVIKALFIEFWVQADSSAANTVVLALAKLPSGVAEPTFTELNNIQSYLNKKNILVFHEGLTPSSGNIIPLFREWIKIPKGKQRFGLGDRFNLSIATLANGDLCGFSTYKEYE